MIRRSVGRQEEGDERTARPRSEQDRVKLMTNQKHNTFASKVICAS